MALKLQRCRWLEIRLQTFRLEGRYVESESNRTLGGFLGLCCHFFPVGPCLYAHSMSSLSQKSHTWACYEYLSLRRKNFPGALISIKPCWNKCLKQNLGFLSAFLFLFCPRNLSFLSAFLLLLPAVEQNNNPLRGSESYLVKPSLKKDSEAL